MMLLTMTYHDVHRKIDDQPFKPFGIKLVNNTTYDITEPWMVIIGESSAIVVTQTRVDERGNRIALDWRTISISHILEFQNFELPPQAKRKRA
jgi:hypothetical protein